LGCKIPDFYPPGSHPPGVYKKSRTDPVLILHLIYS
jgi:hypothetical protein